MRQFLFYLRTTFCKHNWKFEEAMAEWVTHNEFDKIVNKKTNISVSATCVKCGWHRKYTKFP